MSPCCIARRLTSLPSVTGRCAKKPCIVAGAEYIQLLPGQSQPGGEAKTLFRVHHGKPKTFSAYTTRRGTIQEVYAPFPFPLSVFDPGVSRNRKFSSNSMIGTPSTTPHETLCRSNTYFKRAPTRAAVKSAKHHPGGVFVRIPAHVFPLYPMSVGGLPE